MLWVEMATTPSQHAKGLMYRTKLNNDTGMMFVFSNSKELNFWGVNTYIPLDIAFIDKNDCIRKIAHIKPFREDLVSSGCVCNRAIEVNYGYFEENNIKEGDYIVYKNKNKKNAVVSFINQKKTAQFQEEKDFREQYPFDNEKGDLPIIDPEDLDQYIEDYNEYQDEAEPEITPDSEAIPDQIEDQYKIDEEAPQGISPEETIEYSMPKDINLVGKPIKIWYKTKAGRNIERIIEPHDFFTAKSTGNKIIVSYDRTVGDIRAFIVNNILWIDVLKDEFSPKFKIEKQIKIEKN